MKIFCTIQAILLQLENTHIHMDIRMIERNDLIRGYEGTKKVAHATKTKIELLLETV